MLNPVYYAVSGVMWVWHHLFAALFGSSSGLTWALSVVFLVVTLRAVMIRSFLSQMRSARALRALAPQLAMLRERHAKDPRRLAEETRRLQAEHGVSILGGVLPVLAQIPVFIGLLHVLRSFNRPGLTFEQNSAIANYAFAPEQVRSFLEARLWGAPLSAYVSMPQELLDSFGLHVERWEVYAVAVPLMLVAAVATYFSARHSLRQQEVGQVASILRWTPWLYPLGAIGGGLFFPFPLAILIYWLTNNVWTLAQQHVVHRWLERRPAPVVTAGAAVGDGGTAPGPSGGRPGATPVRSPRPTASARTGPNPSGRSSSRRRRSRRRR